MIDEEELRYYIRKTDELEEKLDKLVKAAMSVIDEHCYPPNNETSSIRKLKELLKNEQ